jgi:hypothetical protein
VLAYSNFAESVLLALVEIVQGEVLPVQVPASEPDQPPNV